MACKRGKKFKFSNKLHVNTKLCFATFLVQIPTKNKMMDALSCHSILQLVVSYSRRAASNFPDFLTLSTITIGSFLLVYYLPIFNAEQEQNDGVRTGLSLNNRSHVYIIKSFLQSSADLPDVSDLPEKCLDVPVSRNICHFILQTSPLIIVRRFEGTKNFSRDCLCMNA